MARRAEQCQIADSRRSPLWTRLLKRNGVVRFEARVAQQVVSGFRPVTARITSQGAIRFPPRLQQEGAKARCGVRNRPGKPGLRREGQVCHPARAP